jgi:hypothetical protein
VYSSFKIFTWAADFLFLRLRTFDLWRVSSLGLEAVEQLAASEEKLLRSFRAKGSRLS